MKPMKRAASRRLLLVLGVFAIALIAVLATAALALGQGSSPQKAKHTPPSKAKNVIVMISDGTGYNTWTAGDYWEKGKTGTQTFEQFPVKLGVSTFPLNGSYSSATAWGSFGGVLGDSSNLGITESDMAATAMATGLKTAGGVGWAPPAGGVTAVSQPNILEAAQALGKSTGVVTTKFFDDATPAGFTAHVNNRDLYWTIADQMIDVSKLDVIMGAGNPFFDASGNAVDPLAPKTAWTDGTTSYSTKKPTLYLGQREWNALVGGYAPDADHNGVLDAGATPWTLVQTRSDFQKLEHGKTPARVFGLAQSGGKSLQEKRGTTAAEWLANPYVVPFTKNVPRIAEMTAGALNVLDNNRNGFVAMIEAGGAVDDACHDGFAGRVMEEYDQFNASMKVVLEWIEDHGGWDQNLLIVTSDHDTGYLWGAGSHAATATVPGDPMIWRPIVNNGKRHMPGFDFFSTWDAGKGIFWHTNSLVPLWANGAGSATLQTMAAAENTTDAVRGSYIDNTDIFDAMYEAIN
jgi:alkaline phosphatase